MTNFSFFDPCFVRSAFYFKTLEGFLEAGPQLVLQLSLLFRGHWTRSGLMALSGAGAVGVNATVVPALGGEHKEEIGAFGRVYDEGES